MGSSEDHDHKHKGENGVSVESKQSGNAHQVSEEEEEYDVAEYKEKMNLVVKPLDRGYAWAIMASGFFCSLIVDGIIYSFGMLLEDFTQAFHSTTATVSIAGSLLAALYMCEGPILSALIEKFGYRKISMVGSALASAAFFIASLANDVSLFIIAYGVIGGVSLGLIYLPSMIIVCQYFQKYRPVATGVAAAGSGVGMLVFAPLTKALYEWYGWRGTLLILSALCLQTMPFCALYRKLRTFYVPELKKLRREMIRSHVLATRTETDSGVPQSDGVDKDSGVNVNMGVRVPLLLVNGGVRTSAPGSRRSLTATSHEHVRKVDSSSTDTECFRSRTSLGSPIKSKIGVVGSTTNSRYTASMDALHASGHTRSRTKSVTADEAEKDVGRPFQRADALYTGSVTQLKVYKDALAKSREILNADYPDGRKTSLKNAEVEQLANEIYTEEVTRMAPSRSVCEEHTERKGFDKFWNHSVPRVMNTMFAFTLLREPSFLVILIGNFSAFTGLLVIMMYVPNFARQNGVNSQQQALLIVILGLLNTIGRIFFNFLAQRMPGWKRLALHNITSIIAGVVTLFVPLCSEYWMLCAYCAVFGLFLAPIISLTTPLLADLFGIETLTQTFGLMCMIRGLACFVGPPLGGMIKDATGGYSITFIVGGGVYILAGLICCLLHLPCIKRVRFLESRRKAQAASAAEVETAA